MIQHEQYDSQIVKTIQYNQNMQFGVDPMDQTGENRRYMYGSFKNDYASQEKKSQNSSRIFLDMRFSQGCRKKAALS